MAWIQRFYHDPSAFKEDDHIRTRLEDLLNAQRGFSSRIAEVGVLELGDAVSADGLSPEYLEDLAAMVERWEPRVHVIGISALPGANALRPRLSLEVETRSSRKRLHVTFDRQAPIGPTHGGPP